MNWPEGHIAILFTDIEGSTPMSRAVGDAVYQEALRAPHNRAIRAEAEKAGGFEVGTPAGDSFMLVFDTSDRAVACALGIQRALQESPIRVEAGGRQWTVRVRVGIHTSETPLRRSEEGEYVSSDVAIAARVEALAAGSQVLLSTNAWRACATAGEHRWQRWPNRRLRGVERLETLYELLWDEASRGEPGAAGRPLHEQARALWETGRWSEAHDRLETALEAMRQNGDRRGEGVTLANLGALLLRLHQVGRALTRLEEALEVARELGDRELEARTLGNLAVAWRSQGRYDPAERVLRQALRLRQDLRDLPGAARTMLWLARLHAEEGHMDRAAHILAEGRDLSARHGLGSAEAEALREAALVALAQERPERAEALLQEALALVVPRGDRRGEARIHASLGQVARVRDDALAAESHLRSALETMQEVGDEAGASRVLVSLGALRLEAGDPVGARAFLQQGLEGFERLGDAAGVSLARADLALVERSEGHAAQARDLALQAARELDLLGDRARAGRIRRWVEAWEAEAAPTPVGQAH